MTWLIIWTLQTTLLNVCTCEFADMLLQCVLRTRKDGTKVLQNGNMQKLTVAYNDGKILLKMEQSKPDFCLCSHLSCCIAQAHVQLYVHINGLYKQDHLMNLQ
ncbi:hypothetical protein CRENBAI_009405 [Crenichthys baileyi]|uniref:Uncharacterized protein n=1 Tax=Crenichthys baileyi TaxID=28760 RepID=A0AAV9S6K3_9TELE